MTEKIYEDGEIKILLEGRKVIVMPYEPVSALDVSENIFSKVCLASTLCSAIVFETLSAQGTNIVINNEKSIFSSHIIPRFENDGLNFMWKPKNLEESEIKSVKEKISDELFKLNSKKSDQAEPSVKKEIISDSSFKEETKTSSNNAKQEKSDKETVEEKELIETEEKKEKNPINYIINSLKRKP